MASTSSHSHNRACDDEEMSDSDDAAGSKHGPKRRRAGFYGLVRDVVVAFGIVALLMLSLYLYTGNWPPMVVIESESMQHSEDSVVGVIDTGDLVLVKAVDSRDDVVTWVEGRETGYTKYGDYGDAIIYRKNGGRLTPVIHRAIVWIEFNETTGNSFDAPSLGVYNERTRLIIHNLTSYHTNEEERVDFVINIKKILENAAKFPGVDPSGYVTKGDHNREVDQEGGIRDENAAPVLPVKIDWIVGKARGGLPWFGLIKLYVNGDLEKGQAPQSSVNMLVASILLIIAAPVALDMIFALLAKRRKMEEELEEKGTPRDDDGGGGSGPPEEGSRMSKFDLLPGRRSGD